MSTCSVAVIPSARASAAVGRLAQGRPPWNQPVSQDRRLQAPAGSGRRASGRLAGDDHTPGRMGWIRPLNQLHGMCRMPGGLQRTWQSAAYRPQTASAGQGTSAARADFCLVRDQVVIWAPSAVACGIFSWPRLNLRAPQAAARMPGPMRPRAGWDRAGSRPAAPRTDCGSGNGARACRQRSR